MVSKKEEKKKIVARKPRKEKTFPVSPLKIGTQKKAVKTETPTSPSPKAKLAKQKKIMFQVLADHYKTYHELLAAVPPK